MRKFILFMNMILCMVFTIQAQQYTGSNVPEATHNPDAVKKHHKTISNSEKVEKISSYNDVRSYNLQQRIDLLENKHKAFYSLPYPQDYISNTVMPSIRNERKIVAPGFPERTLDKARDKENLSYWLENNTEELIQYLIFLDDKYISLKNAVK